MRTYLFPIDFVLADSPLESHLLLLGFYPCAAFDSRAKSAAFACRPPAKPVSDPSEPMTRWQGTMIDNGFLPLASPTAREALAEPMALAKSR